MWVMAANDRAISSNDSYDSPQQSLRHSVIPLHVLCKFKAKEEVLWFLWLTARPWPGLFPIQGVKVCLSCCLCKHSDWCLMWFFFSPLVRFREERASLWGTMVWCELLLHFNSVRPWSGLHVSERKSSGVEGDGAFVFAALPNVLNKLKLFFFMPFIFSSSLHCSFNVLHIIDTHFLR